MKKTPIKKIITCKGDIISATNQDMGTKNAHTGKYFYLDSHLGWVVADQKATKTNPIVQGKIIIPFQEVFNFLNNKIKLYIITNDAESVVNGVLNASRAYRDGVLVGKIQDNSIQFAVKSNCNLADYLLNKDNHKMSKRVSFTDWKKSENEFIEFIESSSLFDDNEKRKIYQSFNGWHGEFFIYQQNGLTPFDWYQHFKDGGKIDIKIGIVSYDIKTSFFNVPNYTFKNSTGTSITGGFGGEIYAEIKKRLSIV